MRGLYLIQKDGKVKLMYNGVEVSSASTSFTNNFGTYVLGDKLSINGQYIAKSKTNGTLKPIDSSLYFNEVKLNSTGICINITAEDYKVLYSGGVVPGYKAYDSNAIYNIVDSVDGASVISYSITDGNITFSNGVTADISNNTIYDGIVIEESDNDLDPDANINNTNAPFVCVKYFNPMVPLNGTIGIEYYVDGKGLASRVKGDVVDSFTVIIKVKDGNTIKTVKKTTHAGLFTLETPTLTTQGQTWLSVECIDSNGVGSFVQYYDILVGYSVVPNYYTMREEDLVTYGIVLNNSTQENALANKASLTNFFASVKEDGYNGVVMLKGTYYIDYHAITGYGTQTYTKVKVDINTRKVTEVVGTVSEDSILASGAQTTFSANLTNGKTSFVVDDFFVSDADTCTKWLDKNYIVKEGNNYYIYHVVNTSVDGSDIVFPDEFTVDLNGAKIKAISSTDLSHGRIVYLHNNYDTHIKNGYIEGNYKEYDFRLNAIRIGNMNPSEWLHSTAIDSCKYCSFEDVDISNFVGYGTGAGGEVGVVASRVALTFSSVDSIDGPDGSISLDNDCVESQYIDITNYPEISMGRYGYGGYSMGKRREIFYSFYTKEDNLYTYLTTIKSKFYMICKVPEGATHVKVIGYGAPSDYPIYYSGTGAMYFWRENKVSKNIIYNRCKWHDTRTCAVDPSYVRTLLYKDCIFENIAKETNRPITKMLGDLEDGFQAIQNVAFIGCTCTKGTGMNNMYIHYCNGLTFENNTGIILHTHGGVEHGFVVNNTLPSMKIEINNRSQYPFVIYDNNSMDTLEVEYSSETIFANEEEQTAQSYIEMSNTTIAEHCYYTKLKLHNSMNGDKWYA